MKLSKMKRLIMEVLPTDWSPKRTILHLVAGLLSISFQIINLYIYTHYKTLKNQNQTPNTANKQVQSTYAPNYWYQPKWIRCDGWKMSKFGLYLLVVKMFDKYEKGCSGIRLYGDIIYAIMLIHWLIVSSNVISSNNLFIGVSFSQSKLSIRYYLSRSMFVKSISFSRSYKFVSRFLN